MRETSLIGYTIIHFITTAINITKDSPVVSESDWPEGILGEEGFFSSLTENSEVMHKEEIAYMDINT